MSYEAILDMDEDNAIQVGTSKGWPQFAHWVIDECPDLDELQVLAQWNQSEHLDALLYDLKIAVKRAEESDPDSAHIAQGLIDFLNRKGNAEVITIANGVT